MSKFKAHQQYKVGDKIVPGVTTITNELGWNRSAIKWWAYKMGRQDIDIKDYTSDKAKIGTLAHKLIEQHLSEMIGQELDLIEFRKDYTANQIDQAENSCLSYFEWEKNHKIQPIWIERQLTSERYEYGGTPDFFGKVDGQYEVIDFKTSSGIYDEHIIQISAYEKLIEETVIWEDYDELSPIVDRLRIFRIPRTEDETFDEKLIESWSDAFRIFHNCLEIYNLKKRI